MFIESTNIKVYPTAKRSSSIDYSANLNLEQNIVGITKNITDYPSYIIDEDYTDSDTDINYKGLDLELDGTDLIVRKGKCVIGGYYINIVDKQTISLTNIDTSVNKVVYFKLNIDSFTGTDIKYINGYDNLSDEYTGLTIEIENTIDTNLTPSNYLKLGNIINNGTEVTLERKNKKFSANNIHINLDSSVGLSEEDVDSSLNNWLVDTFIIDDGNI